MKISVVYGNQHRGNTWNLAQTVLDHFSGAEKIEFFLPAAMPHFCNGCLRCLSETPKACPHDKWIDPIRTAMLEADLIVLTSPVYVFHLSGQMKAFLDHFSYFWMVHQPHPAMFHKQALVVATSAGSPTTNVMREIGDSLAMWGIPRVYRYGMGMGQPNWDAVSDKVKARIKARGAKLAAKIRANQKESLSPSLRTWVWFNISRLIQTKFKFSQTDIAHWNKLGWDQAGRPWKEKDLATDMSVYPDVTK